MAGYTRQSTIADGNVIDAVLFNDEFDKLLAAFVATSGHKHDGTAAEGAVIPLIGDTGVATPLNKILIDTANNHLEFYTDVSSAAVQQLRIEDGAIVPILDNDIDLGTGSLEFKDGHFDGTVNLDTLVIGTSTGITSVDTDLTAVSASDDTLASAKAIKAYVDAVPIGDLTAITAGNGLSGTSLTGPIPDLFIDTAITVDKTTAQTLTNKTLTSPVLDTTISGTAFLDEDTMSSNSDTKVASQQSIKTYVDTQVATIPVGDITSVVAGAGMTGGGTSGDVTLNVIGGTGITANANDITIDGTVATLTGTQVLSAKTLTSPVLNGTLSGTAFLDEDTLSSDSAIAVASQQSIKAYIDNNVSSVTPSSTTTFTNKTIDANGTGNSISNLEVADLASGVLDIDLTSVAATDTTLASAKAIKTYVDSQSHSNVTASSTTTFTNKTIDVDATGNSITNLANANIKAAAAIDATKIADGTVTDSEFQFINSLSANAQTQIDSKQATIDSSNRLNANLVGDGSVDNTEFGYLNGVTSDIQAQISTKASAGFAVAMAIAL